MSFIMGKSDNMSYEKAQITLLEIGQMQINLNDDPEAIKLVLSNIAAHVELVAGEVLDRRDATLRLDDRDQSADEHDSPSDSHGAGLEGEHAGLQRLRRRKNLPRHGDVQTRAQVWQVASLWAGAPDASRFQKADLLTMTIKLLSRCRGKVHSS